MGLARLLNKGLPPYVCARPAWEIRSSEILSGNSRVDSGSLQQQICDPLACLTSVGGEEVIGLAIPSCEPHCPVWLAPAPSMRRFHRGQVDSISRTEPSAEPVCSTRPNVTRRWLGLAGHAWEHDPDVSVTVTEPPVRSFLTRRTSLPRFETTSPPDARAQYPPR
jgi:hypothetical protein